VQVRPIDPSSSAELDRIVAINDAEVPAVGPLGRAQLEHLVGQSVQALVACDDGGTIAGFCLVLAPGADYGSMNYRWFAERYDDFVYLDRVAVAPEFRRRGVGTALYRAVENATDAPWFTLEVNLRPRNDTSLTFHAHLGFVEVGQQETDYGALVSLMAKPLT
jgi:predicted GNAT superfamily acetyltransferase